MRQSPFAPIASLPWLVLAACTVSSARPPELGTCEVDDASCPATTIGGGVGGGGDSGASASSCSISAGDSQCTQCADANCCPALGTCTASADCNYLLGCEPSCSTAACVSSCEMHAPGGASLLGAFTSCLEARCPVCSERGTGDPCSSVGGGCNPGLTCSGPWCTKACARSTDCTGIGAGGGNALGLPNACIVTGPGEETCLPGCAADSDCDISPGAFCLATTSVDGLSVRVCSAPPDAGTD